jgi:tRNA(fMet)-specific endonuclease VapC
MHLIDTSICIAILRGKSPRVRPRFRAAMSSGIAVSSITVAELYYGVARAADQTRERAGVENLLGSVSVLSFDSIAAEGSGLLRRYLERRGETIGSFDLLIAAHAIAENATLVTDNFREFSRVPTLSMENWL